MGPRIIRVVAVGRMGGFFRPAQEEFSKRLQGIVKLELIEVRDEALPDHLIPALVEEVKTREAERLLRALKGRGTVVALDRGGIMWTSEELSAFLERTAMAGTSEVSFLVGGTMGLGAGVLKAADQVWSLSRLTLPHQLARVVLLEQVYRAYKILRGEPYHR